MNSLMPPKGQTKVARCKTCKRISAYASMPAADTSPGMIREFAAAVKKGYEVAVIDDPAEVQRMWGECVHMKPQLGQGALFS